jgi:hydroxycarboxylate dehydrogenase B
MADMIRIKIDRLIDYVATVFERAGTPAKIARRAAESLAGANLAGHDSHGVVRVQRYVQSIQQGLLDAAAKPTLVVDLPSIAVVDGNSGFGQHIGREAMKIGIRKAKKSGLCVVATRRSFHLGRIGEWAEQCVEADLVSLHFVNVLNAGGLAAPFGGKERRMSTNPIAIGLPVPGHDPVVLDMATTKVAEGKVLVALNKGVELPVECLIDADGRPTLTPADLYGPPQGALLHFGLHKGYGLALAAELLAGAVTGGGTNQPAHPITGAVHNSMLSIILDPKAFGTKKAYGKEARAMVAHLLSTAPVDPDNPVMIAGDPERRNRAERLKNGVPLDLETWGQMAQTGRSVGLKDSEIKKISGQSAKAADTAKAVASRI